MKLSIIIPAHNEADRLPPVLEAYASCFEAHFGSDVELLVVVNGSTDATRACAEAGARSHPSVRVIEEPARVGKGGAVLLGARQAVGEWIGFVDADGSTSPEEFLRLYELAQGTDGVIASRWMPGATVSVRQTGLRRLSSRMFNLLTRGLLGLKVHDTQCGAKIFHQRAWHAILPEVGITRYAFDVDLLFHLKRAGFSIREVPTVWHDVPGSKVRVMQSSFDMFCALIRMRLLYSPFRFLVTVYERLFSRAVEFLRRDELFCHASLLFMAAMVGHLCNIAYQMVVSRALPDTEFALLTTFLALFSILVRPLGTLTTAMVHYTSLLLEQGRKGSIAALTRKWSLLVGIPSVCLSALCVAYAGPIAGFFHLDRTAPVVVSALALPMLFLGPVVGGALRGMQCFGWISLTTIGGSLGRVVLAAAFVFWVFPASGWALAGHVGGMYLTGLLSVALLWWMLRGQPSSATPLPSLRFYLARCFLIQVAMAILATGDVVLVKRYLPDETDFAYAATLGRLVAFLTVEIITAMFPKVVSTGEFTAEHRRVYLRSLLYTTVLVLAAVLLCTAVPELLHRVLFRITAPSENLLFLTRAMALVMALTALLNINISLLLAQRRFGAASVAVAAALLYLLSVHHWHRSASDVVAACAVLTLASLLFTTQRILARSPGTAS